MAIVEQIFHAVGHGTFSTGRIGNFNWVYDCGAKAKKSVLIPIIGKDYSNKKINMLVLSHFDEDHINGLEDLLKYNEVEMLILPYIPWEELFIRLVAGRARLSEDTFKIAINIKSWLEEKNLNEKVTKILFIKAGSSTNEDEINSFLFNIQETKRSNKLQPKMETKSFTWSTNNYEFLFFNTTKNYSGFYLKGLTKLDNLREAIKADLMELYSGKVINFTEWLAKVKKKYKKHFGNGNNANNDISLCMYVGRKFPPGQYTFLKNKNQNLISFIKNTDLSSIKLEQIYALYTGDITLNPDIINDMKTHFGTERWNKINILQVPHHGSQHSWKISPECFPNGMNFIQCASFHKGHPHKSVLNSLKGFNVYNATKENKVVIEVQ